MNRAAARRFSIVVPVRDKLQFLKPCLDSLMVAVDQFGESEIIIVDNNSAPETAEFLKVRYADRAILLHSTAATVSAVRNLGASHATGTVLCFVDSDCIVPADYLHRVADTLDANRPAAVGHQVRLPGLTWIDRCWHDLHFIPKQGEVPWLNGACLNVTAHAFRAVGGFREDLISGEDVDLSERLVQAGFRVESSPSLVITHLDNPSSAVEFFRKEWWRGLGLWTAGDLRRDRIRSLGLTHVALSVMAVAGAVLLPVPVAVRVAGALGSTLLAPTAAVAHRQRQLRAAGKPVNRVGILLSGIALYCLYFWARGLAAIMASVTVRQSIR